MFSSQNSSRTAHKNVLLIADFDRIMMEVVQSSSIYPLILAFYNGYNKYFEEVLKMYNNAVRPSSSLYFAAGASMSLMKKFGLSLVPRIVGDSLTDIIITGIVTINQRLT